MVGRVYGLQKVYRQNEKSNTYLTDTKLFMFDDARKNYCKKYIFNQKKNSRVEKLFFFECEMENFREIDLEEKKEEEK